MQTLSIPLVQMESVRIMQRLRDRLLTDGHTARLEIVGDMLKISTSAPSHKLDSLKALTVTEFLRR